MSLDELNNCKLVMFFDSLTLFKRKFDVYNVLKVFAKVFQEVSGFSDRKRFSIKVGLCFTLSEVVKNDIKIDERRSLLGLYIRVITSDAFELFDKSDFLTSYKTKKILL